MRKDIWICIEKGAKNCSAYAPAVPGCVSTGKTVEETKRNMEEALAFHIDGMMEDGVPIDAVASDFPAEFIRSSEEREEEYFVLLHLDISPVSPVLQA